jgi:hypothetical protein
MTGETFDQSKETTMPQCSESQGYRSAARCAVCNGKFGLVRHYSWRTALCSSKCVDRFKARRQNDGSWMNRLQIAFDQLPDNRARAS